MLEEFLGSHELKLGPVGVKILFCNLFAGGGGGWLGSHNRMSDFTVE